MCKRLPATWRLLKAWSIHEIPARAPPLPEDALHTMVGYALLFKFALSLLVGFYGVLRTGEILGIVGRSVAVDTSWTSRAFVGVHQRWPASRRCRERHLDR